MRLHEVLPEKTMIENPDPHEFGEIGHGPTWYLHYCHTDADVQSIESRGFDMQHWGRTAQKYNVPDIAKNDLYGAYATEFLDLKYVDKNRPFLVFQVLPLPNVLSAKVYRGGSDNLMSKMAQAYGFTGKKLTALLLKNDIQVVHSLHEFCILTPERVRIAETSIRLKADGVIA